MSLRFLLRETVVALHEEHLDLFGGLRGIRDEGLLDSALAQPEATFGGEYLHPTLHDMAAAYLFHLVRNHPFLDGNKRSGYLTALLFLAMNGVPTEDEFDELYDVTMAVAEGRLDKATVAATLLRLYPLPPASPP